MLILNLELLALRLAEHPNRAEPWTQPENRKFKCQPHVVGEVFEHFSDDVEGAVDIGMHNLPAIVPLLFVDEHISVVRTSIAVSHGLCAGWVVAGFFVIDLQLFVCHEASFAGVAFFRQHYGDAMMLSFVRD
jgi:hypothetical protein